MLDLGPLKEDLSKERSEFCLQLLHFFWQFVWNLNFSKIGFLPFCLNKKVDFPDVNKS